MEALLPALAATLKPKPRITSANSRWRLPICWRQFPESKCRVTSSISKVSGTPRSQAHKLWNNSPWHSAGAVESAIKFHAQVRKTYLRVRQPAASGKSAGMLRSHRPGKAAKAVQAEAGGTRPQGQGAGQPVGLS